MSDLISRESAIDAMYMGCYLNPKDRGDLIKALERLPTIDAVPVVRCKDCVCGEERVDKNRLTYWFCTFGQHPTAKHNYCVWGERKDDE